ncbi:hypothetical protein BJ742DRAFT_769594 [Cladochytrium replicatum]|nr:hypothetical protein BJ742DRAFT_769594 [Cladochytrium replicatum]
MAAEIFHHYSSAGRVFTLGTGLRAAVSLVKTTHQQIGELESFLADFPLMSRLVDAEQTTARLAGMMMGLAKADHGSILVNSPKRDTVTPLKNLATSLKEITKKSPKLTSTLKAQLERTVNNFDQITSYVQKIEEIRKCVREEQASRRSCDAHVTVWAPSVSPWEIRVSVFDMIGEWSSSITGANSPAREKRMANLFRCVAKELIDLLDATAHDLSKGMDLTWQEFQDQLDRLNEKDIVAKQQQMARERMRRWGPLGGLLFTEVSDEKALEIYERENPEAARSLKQMRKGMKDWEEVNKEMMDLLHGEKGLVKLLNGFSVSVTKLHEELSAVQEQVGQVDASQVDFGFEVGGALNEMKGIVTKHQAGLKKLSAK